MRVIVLTRFADGVDWLESWETFAEVPTIGTVLQLYSNEPPYQVIDVKASPEDNNAAAVVWAVEAEAIGGEIV